MTDATPASGEQSSRWRRRPRSSSFWIVELGAVTTMLVIVLLLQYSEEGYMRRHGLRVTATVDELPLGKSDCRRCPLLFTIDGVRHRVEESLVGANYDDEATEHRYVPGEIVELYVDPDDMTHTIEVLAIEQNVRLGVIGISIAAAFAVAWPIHQFRRRTKPAGYRPPTNARSARVANLAPVPSRAPAVHARTVTEVAEQLRLLAKLDGGRRGKLQVFGARSHQYRSTPVAPADIERLESDLHTGLPREFKEFLLAVGGGAGPYHGLYSAELIRTSLANARSEAVAASVTPPRPHLPFPYSREDAAAAVREQRAIDGSSLLDGCVVIGHEGSGTQWTVLVVSGPLAGTVWDLLTFGGHEGHWFPGCVPPGVLGPVVAAPPLPAPPSFLEWYASWIAVALSGLQR